MGMSEKQWQIMTFPLTSYEALICDGAIRTGKTTFMAISFIDDAMRRFNGQRFAICGKTVESTVKNILQPYLAGDWWKVKQYGTQWRNSEKTLTVTLGDVRNTFEIFGGRDESSYTLIQGRTLAGVLLDEVALQPRSFVEQALARCSVAGSKFWFNCNPAGNLHWFNQEWIQHPEKHNALHLHFTLDDNPGLAPEIRQRYMTMYSGVFYQRYILGLWVNAEGLVYAQVANDLQRYTTKQPAEAFDGAWYISMDYGTHNPCSMGLWCVANGKAVRVKESYFDSRAAQYQKTDEEHYKALEQLAEGHYIRYIVCDPSAASFIETVRRHGRFKVLAADNDVLNGIRATQQLLQAGRVLIHDSCADAKREFCSYSWDDKRTEDAVIKENDHAMDDIRYFCYTVLARELRWANWGAK